MNQDKSYILAIDNGTQSVRALIFELDGLLVAKNRILLGNVMQSLSATMVNLNHEGKSLRPAFVWLDQRQQDKLDKLNPVWELLFSLAGERETVTYFHSQAEANWIKLQQPEFGNKHINIYYSLAITVTS
jgi:sugar (pentulose or hexulose) kinase